MKKLTALMMSLLMLLLCAACAPKEQLTVNVAAMKGPTGIGMAQLSSLAEEGKTEYNYSITYAGSPDIRRAGHSRRARESGRSTLQQN